MITGSNRERIEQEIANLISFISDGREFFFQETGLSLQSSDDWFDHFITKDVFQEYTELKQLELNIQLFYIKLSSYYEIVSRNKVVDMRKQRNAFAHELTPLIFNGVVKYNFFLHKASKNFKKIQFIFYEEDENKLVAEGSIKSKTLDLNLDKDINDFILTWKAKR